MKRPKKFWRSVCFIDNVSLKWVRNFKHCAALLGQATHQWAGPGLPKPKTQRRKDLGYNSGGSYRLTMGVYQGRIFLREYKGNWNAKQARAMFKDLHAWCKVSPSTRGARSSVSPSTLAALMSSPCSGKPRTRL